jgi:energy-coupling factor transporter ATP-binding protein EcfA2
VLKYAASETLKAVTNGFERIKGIGTKLVLWYKLKIAEDAIYDSYTEGASPSCLQGTRVELLRQVCDWIADLKGKRIFWLCGKAGTGKSTLSRSVAQMLKDKGRLGATFFFSRGHADRSHARLFFPTIARQLTEKLPGLGDAIVAALEKDSSLCGSHLRKQFDELLLNPMLSGLQNNILKNDVFLVMDALDECEDSEAVTTILRLLKQIETITTARVRIFVTSRPEMPILSVFDDMSKNLYQDIQLEEAQAPSIRSDLLMLFTVHCQQIGLGTTLYSCLWTRHILFSSWPLRSVGRYPKRRNHKSSSAYLQHNRTATKCRVALLVYTYKF